MIYHRINALFTSECQPKAKNGGNMRFPSNRLYFVYRCSKP